MYEIALKDEEDLEIQANYPAFFNPATAVLKNVLSLPKLAEDIPLTFSNGLPPILGTLGKRMLNMGAKLENNPQKDILLIIKEGLERMFNQYPMFAELETLSLGVSIEVSSHTNHPVEEHPIAFNLNFPMDEAPAFIMDNLNEVRKKCPPLAWYFWSVIEKASQFIPFITPSMFLSLVEHHEWMGELDETGYINMMIDEGSDIDSIEVIKYADVINMLGTWSLRACHSDFQRIRKHIQYDALDEKHQKICDVLDDTASTIFELTNLKNIGDFVTDTSFGQFGAISFFDDAARGGLCYQVFDLHYQNMMEIADEYESLQTIAFNPSHEESQDHVFEFLFQLSELWRKVIESYEITGEKL